MVRRDEANGEPGPDDGLVAFVDESMRFSVAGAGLYLVTAAVVVETDRTGVEDRLRVAAGRRRHRIHWRNEAEAVRLKLLDTLAAQPLRGVTAVVEPTTPRRQERARSQAWWTLAWQIEHLGVNELVIEARQEQLNNRDHRTIATLRRAGIATRLHYRFGLPTEEPGLWAADVLAGAIGHQLATGEGRYVERLPERLVAVHRVAG